MKERRRDIDYFLSDHEDGDGNGDGKEEEEEDEEHWLK
jgi:hypothetical protein